MSPTLLIRIDYITRITNEDRLRRPYHQLGLTTSPVLQIRTDYNARMIDYDRLYHPYG